MQLQPKLPLAPAALALLVACDVMDPRDAGLLVPRTVEEDPTLPAIEMNGSRFHLETRGDPADPVIIFLHGGPGGDYRSMLRLSEPRGGPSLADNYHLVFWDQRGSGLSMRHDKNVLTIDTYLDDLHSLVDRYALGRDVFLVGNSWGGMYATAYINTHPDRVAGAVLVEPGPLNATAFEQIRNDLFDLNLGAEWLNDWAWNSQFFSADDHVRMDYERMLGMRHSQPRFHQRMDVDPAPSWRLGAAANRYVQEDGMDDDGNAVYDFTSQLHAYQTPVLFVAGARSEVLGETFQTDQMQHYPSASLLVIEDAGHDVGWTHADEVLVAIRTYLNERQGGLQ